MYIAYKLNLALLATLVLGQVLRAEVFQGRAIYSVGLLENKSVHKELRLGADQVHNIDKFANKIREKYLESITELSSDATQREKLHLVIKKVNKELYTALTGVLKPEQKKRLQQLVWQAQGEEAFQDPEVLQTLKLTDEQREKIDAIAKDLRKRLDTAEKRWDLRREASKKAAAVLNENQKKTWQDMTGAPFEFEWPEK